MKRKLFLLILGLIFIANFSMTVMAQEGEIDDVNELVYGTITENNFYLY